MKLRLLMASCVALGVAGSLLHAAPVHAQAEVAVAAGLPADEDVLREIPAIAVVAEKRNFTVEDLLLLRDAAGLSVSPDGSHFAIFVRQAVPARNSYRSGWFVGSRDAGELVFVGDGGESYPSVRPDGNIVGELQAGVGRWSPDGEWIAYLVKRAGEVQVWRSRRDGSAREQVTRNAADVLDFAWSGDGRHVYFTAGTSRAQLLARYEAEARRGYAFDDYGFTSRIMTPGHPPRAAEADPQTWKVDVGTGVEGPATETEEQEFARLRDGGHVTGAGGAADEAGGAEVTGAGGAPRERPAAVVPHPGTRAFTNSRGSWAWLTPDATASLTPRLRLHTSAPDGSSQTTCAASECVGPFMSVLGWRSDGKRVIFWNADPQNGFDPVLYAWTPSNGRVSVVVPSTSDRFYSCDMRSDVLLCLRDTNTQPLHVATINTRSGKITVIADVNPELKNVRFGKVERIEWDVPSALPEVGYAPRAMGYILYPPDFDPLRKYPVFIAPYNTWGFHRGDVGDEHPLFAYAASGILVLHTNFPNPTGSVVSMSGTDLMKLVYSGERDFPHLTTLMSSTFRALDLVAKRGFVDEKRVGIGGVSQGSFVPLFMLQKQDRLAALAIAGGHFNPLEYYSSTKKGRPRDSQWQPAPAGEGMKWWNGIDVAQHADKIEAPILFNFPDTEVSLSLTLMRHMEDERKPFDAYVFPNEYHVKWQSAHREAIYRRNLDWFRFWLQDYEDTSPEKREQYARWRQLRELQCKNPRSLRDYCGVGQVR